jgi:hypothetical protein
MNDFDLIVHYMEKVLVELSLIPDDSRNERIYNQGRIAGFKMAMSLLDAIKRENDHSKKQDRYFEMIDDSFFRKDDLQE